MTAVFTLPSAAQAPAAQKVDKAAAYYHAALGHLYAELAAQYGGRGEYVSKAIDNYRKAMMADPNSPFLANELADLFLQSGQIRTAIVEFEDAVKKNPNDLNSRRILARFYTARIREGQQNRINEEVAGKAIDQYKEITSRDPKDVESLVMLGRLYKIAQKSTDAESAYKKALEADPNNEDAMTGLAQVYSDLGDVANANKLMKQVADKNPNLRSLTTLASTYEQMKDYKLAAETYGKALEMNKENTDLKRAYAQALFMAEDYDKAATVFGELIQDEPNDLLSALRLSQIYRQKKDFDQARVYAKKATTLDPNNLEIRFNEVALLEAEGKSQDAINALKEILNSMPANSDSANERNNRIILLERLGALHRSNEQTAESVAAFREIATLDPTMAARSSALIIETYRGGKEFQAAEKEASEALKKFPSERVVKVTAASAYADLGRSKEAESLLKSLLNGKDDREIYISMAQTYEKSKNYSEMAKVLDAAEKLSEDEDEREVIYFLRGAMFEKMKKFDAAEAEFKKVLAKSPNSASALNYLGYMLVDRNIRVSEGYEMIRKAVDQDPYNGAYLDSLGWAYFRMNKFDEAETQLRRSLERTRRDPTVYDHLGDVYFSQNRLKDAIAQWEISLKEWHANAPSDVDNSEIAKIQKKLESAKVRLAKETGSTPKQP